MHKFAVKSLISRHKKQIIALKAQGAQLHRDGSDFHGDNIIPGKPPNFVFHATTTEFSNAALDAAQDM